MFGGLKDRLQAVRKRLSGSIQEEAIAQAVTASSGSSAAPVPAAPESKNPAAKGPSFVDKVKVLITERELIVSEKNVAEALDELEMTLLESDVALPVTDAIIARVRAGLVGKHRKIGESVDDLVVSALKNALLEVLGKGFDLVSYIRDPRTPGQDPFYRCQRDGKNDDRRKDRRVSQKTRIHGCHRGRRYLSGRCNRADSGPCRTPRHQDHPAPGRRRPFSGALRFRSVCNIAQD